MTLYFESARAEAFHCAKWRFGLILFVAAYVSIAAFMYPGPFLDLSLHYASTFARTIPVVVGGGLAIKSLFADRQHPTQYIIRNLKDRWHILAAVSFAFFLWMIAFSTYKTAIPNFTTFYADKWLVEIDRMIFGRSAWRIAHYADNNLWALFIFICYEKLWFIQWFGTILLSTFWSSKFSRIRYLWAMSLTLCICGTILAMLLASVGPIFYDEFAEVDRFHEFSQAMNELTYSYMIREPASYLLATYRAGVFSLGTGISAMPSVHVAVAVANAYQLSSVNRWAGVVGWIFAVLIFYGSIFTGFHYAVDGIVSFVVVTIIWRITDRMVK